MEEEGIKGQVNIVRNEIESKRNPTRCSDFINYREPIYNFGSKRSAFRSLLNTKYRKNDNK